MAKAALAPESDNGRLRAEIGALGLQTYVADLDADGYTVVPPEIASPNGLAERLLDACLDVAERRNGARPDLEAATSSRRIAMPTGGYRDSPVGDSMGMMLLEDPAFEAALMNPALLALVTHLCSYNVVLSAMDGVIKGPNRTAFELHTDTRLPSPLPTQALVCKGIYLLTDFNRENGCTAFVPGSHKQCRNPVGSETVVGEADSQAVPVEAPAGSLIVFHGNTWHGAYDRIAPGLRVSVHLLMVRPILRTREDLIGRIPQDVLDRNPARFAILAQQGLAPGIKQPGELRAHVMRAQQYISAFEKESGVRLPPKDSS